MCIFSSENLTLIISQPVMLTTQTLHNITTHSVTECYFIGSHLLFFPADISPKAKPIDTDLLSLITGMP